MKAIMISIKPKWVAKILTGEKTIEVRKIQPNVELPIDVYIYCTKEKKEHLIMDIDNRVGINPVPYCYGDEELNGKVVAKFTLNNVEELSCEFHKEPLFGKNTCYQGVNLIVRDEYDTQEYYVYDIQTTNEEGNSDEEIVKKSKFLQQCCLTLTDIKNYVGNKETLYSWHISNLEIFDEPKELCEFKRCTEKTCIYEKCHKYMHCLKPLTKAPQNMCYVEVEE